ncbi:MAG: hypothetical protein J7M14_03985, partial [Planctomycetes bacterium]|nr:hypothetical protein [Planctomycetota bacterium]
MRPDSPARIPAAAAVLALLCLTAMPGCFHAVWASFNDRLAAPAPPYEAARRNLRATRTIVDVRGDRQMTVFLAIS